MAYTGAPLDELLEALEPLFDDVLLEEDDDGAVALELLLAPDDDEVDEEPAGGADAEDRVLDDVDELPIGPARAPGMAESLEDPQATATTATAHMPAASAVSERMTTSSPAESMPCASIARAATLCRALWLPGRERVQHSLRCRARCCRSQIMRIMESLHGHMAIAGPRSEPGFHLSRYRSC